MSENDRGSESNQDTLQAYMEMPQWNPPVQLIFSNNFFNRIMETCWNCSKEGVYEGEWWRGESN
jgi:hypothetical protein